jgi:hypothetical protein
VSVRRSKLPEPTEEDIAWTEEKIIQLMHLGFSFIDSAMAATVLCTERILAREAEREFKFNKAILLAREQRRVEQQQKADEERARRGAERVAKGTPAQRPTLRASIGDLIRRKSQG